MVRFAVSDSSLLPTVVEITFMSSIQITKWTTATFANVGRVCPAVSYTNLTLTCPPGPKSIHRAWPAFSWVPEIQLCDDRDDRGSRSSHHGSYMVDIVGLWWTSSMCSGKSTHSRALLRTPHEKWTLAATSIVVGITTGIGTVIETVATEVIMIVNAMMTEGGGRRCRGMFQGEEPIGRYHYFLDFFLVNWRWCFCGYCDLHSVFLFWRDSFCLVQGL